MLDKLDLNSSMLLEPITCAGNLFQIIIFDGKNNYLDGLLNTHTTTKNTTVTYTRVAIQKCISQTVQRAFERRKAGYRKDIKWKYNSSKNAINRKEIRSYLYNKQLLSHCMLHNRIPDYTFYLNLPFRE